MSRRWTVSARDFVRLYVKFNHWGFARDEKTGSDRRCGPRRIGDGSGAASSREPVPIDRSIARCDRQIQGDCRLMPNTGTARQTWSGPEGDREWMEADRSQCLFRRRPSRPPQFDQRRKRVWLSPGDPSERDRTSADGISRRQQGDRRTSR